MHLGRHLRDYLESLCRWQDRLESREPGLNRTRERRGKPMPSDAQFANAARYRFVRTRACPVWCFHRMPRCPWMLAETWILTSPRYVNSHLCQPTVWLTSLLKLCKTWWKMNRQFGWLFLQTLDCDLETVVPKTTESLKKWTERRPIILLNTWTRSAFETMQTWAVSSCDNKRLGIS